MEWMHSENFYAVGRYILLFSTEHQDSSLLFSFFVLLDAIDLCSDAMYLIMQMASWIHSEDLLY